METILAYVLPIVFFWISFFAMDKENVEFKPKNYLSKFDVLFLIFISMIPFINLIIGFIFFIYAFCELIENLRR